MLLTPPAAGPAARPTGHRVDDDETVRTAVGDMLRGAAYAVTLAGSGLEGIAKVREHEGPYDLVITDLGCQTFSAGRSSRP